MCGLVGVWRSGGLGDLQSFFPAMKDALFNRGPDGSGEWMDHSAGLALGHRRLAVVDLSPAGHQPMSSMSGRYVIAFNGEIYNHALLRAELESESGAMQWRGHSDTETVLAAIDLWGLKATLERCIGMFAISLWDRERRELWLARDRFGEKPLYYGYIGRDLVWASDLASIRQHPGFEGEVSRDALCLYLRHSSIPTPYSIYRGVYKLVPGSLVCYTDLDLRASRHPDADRYWSLGNAVRAGMMNPWKGSDREAVDALDSLLKSAVKQQMQADVPLGAFLSGGVDSSTIVALMQTQSSSRIKTFTIGFEEGGYDEAGHAKLVANRLGTQHTELYVSASQARDVIPLLPDLYSEPFADSSQIPTYLVSRLARSHVTVSLSGDAGDEFFAGYNRYLVTANHWQKIERLPLSLRRSVAKMFVSVPPDRWESIMAPLSGLLPRSLRFSAFGEKIHKAARVLECGSVADVYKGLTSHWSDPEAVVIGGKEPDFPPGGDTLADLGPVERMMSLDIEKYLTDDILTKVDRAAMGVSLETRVPLLDHRVAEFAWRLPLSMKIRDGQGKWPLRQVLYRYVPRELIERPKMGFGIPLDAWLRGPLREWAEELLDEGRIRREGYFRPEPIRRKWAEHLSGSRNWSGHLWDVLMYQSWLERSRG